MESCEKCDQVVTPDSVSVTCTGRCEGTFHAACVNLSAAVADSLATTAGLCWFCDRCRLVKKRKVAKKLDQQDSQQLPTEIWAEIFDHLHTWQLLRVRLVCRRWRDIVGDSLMSKFTARFPKALIIDREYHPVHLLAASEFYFDETRITAVGSWWASFGPNLTGITMFECKVMLPNLLAMLRQTSNLTRLKLYEVIVDTYEGNPDPDFRLDKLKLLAIDGVNRAENLQVFRRICPNLRHLRLVSCYLDERRDAFLRHVVDFVAEQHSSLKSLAIDGDDLLLVELIKLRSWKLKELRLSIGTDFVLSNVRALVDLCRMIPSLEILLVEPGISASQEITRIGQLLPNLKRLELTLKGTLENKPTFLTQMVGLQVLQLKNDAIAYRFIDFEGIVCPHLQSLELGHITCEGHSLQRFLVNAPNLQVLSLNWCKFDCWTEIFRMIGPCRRLQRLTLRWIEADGYNRCFYDYLDDLRYLEVHKCDEIPQEMLSTLLSLCPRLEELYLTSLTQDTINEETLRVICEKLHRLVRVGVIDCDLSELNASYLRENCHVQEAIEIAQSDG